MNFFEQELRKVAGACPGVINPVFAGRSCYCDLGGENKARLQFVTLGYANHYEALKVTVIKRADGVVDALTFRFEDIWGKKSVSNPNFRDGVNPHIWVYDNKPDWYVYQPNSADFRQLAASLSMYLEVFTDHDLLPEKARGQDGEKESVVGKLRESKRVPAPRGNGKCKNSEER